MESRGLTIPPYEYPLGLRFRCSRRWPERCRLHRRPIELRREGRRDMRAGDRGRCPGANEHCSRRRAARSSPTNRRRTGICARRIARSDAAIRPHSPCRADARAFRAEPAFAPRSDTGHGRGIGWPRDFGGCRRRQRPRHRAQTRPRRLRSLLSSWSNPRRFWEPTSPVRTFRGRFAASRTA